MTAIKEELRQKLDAFIRKYYTNRLLKGLIYFIGLSIIYFLIISFLEYFGRFSSNARLALFLVLLTGLSVILAVYIIKPLLGLIRLGKHLSYSQAAKIIGTHFPEVGDKVTNALELSLLTDRENKLIQASIEQRIERVKPIPFTNAVNYKENLKYWPIAVVPLIIFIFLIAGGQWSSIRESSSRIISYDKEFIEAAPFDFLVLNEDFTIERGQNFIVQLSFSGKSIPDNAEIILKDSKGRFVKKGDNLYEYKLENLKEDQSFSVEANGFRSQPYKIEVVAVPELLSYTMEVSPPAYTGLKAYRAEMNSTMEVPAGSNVSWSLLTITTDEAFLETKDTVLPFGKSDNGTFQLSKRLLSGMEYRLLTKNAAATKKSALLNKINVIPDEYPLINGAFIADSNVANRFYYQLEMGDDYGLSRLAFIVENSNSIIVNQPLTLTGSSLIVTQEGILDLDSLKSLKGPVKAYFKVWDNDGVNGAKASISNPVELQILSLKAQEKALEEQVDSYFSEREKMEQLSKQINKELKALRTKLMNSKKTDWTDKEKIRELLRRQDELLKKQQELKKKHEKIKEKEEKLQPKNDEIKEKEEQLEKLQEDADKQKELEKLMEEIDELMKNLDMEKLKEKLEEMERKSSENTRSEERLDELLKDLQFQKDVLKEAEKLKELAEKMEELSKENNEKGDEQQKQDEIKEDFEESADKFEKLKEENDAFNKESEKQKTEESKEKAEEEMKKASDELQKDNQKKANDSQKESSEQMQEMSEKMMNSLMQMQSAQHQENMKTLRQILENLEILSFDVEYLSDLSKTTAKDDPLYRKILVDQKRLQEGSQVIRDSLMALGERVPVIQEAVFKELKDIEVNLEKSIDNLEEQRGAQSASHQQFVMTAANNLALLLDEALRNMQQQMANSLPGNQSCQKPGGQKPSLSNMKKLQSELANELGKMKGNKPGEGEGEGKGEKGKGRNGKEIVEMLSRQEMIRSELENYLKDKQGEGPNGHLQKAIKEMEQIERDLLDGDISTRALERMREIETRLLESEKAEREQREDEQRESQTADEVISGYDKALEKYLKQKEGEKEIIYSEPLKMNPYYKNKSNQFLRP